MTPGHPTLRSDLVISRQDAAGETVFVVKAPATDRFFRLREAEHFIAQQLDGSTSLDIVRHRVQERFGAPVAQEALEQFIEQLRRRGLLEDGETGPGSSIHRRGRIRGSLFYLRLKAFDPDRLFDRLVGKVRWFFTPSFVIASAVLILLALGVSVANSAEIGRGLVALYRLDALLLVWLTILSVTAAHEFAHGLTCKNFGGHVHELGFMLIYFQPAMYCNVSDAWLFPERSRRLWVTFAGAYFELFLWAMATVVWRVSDPHTTLSYMALVVMATSGVKCFFNLNPLIKLDGYYLLSDYLEIPNLRQKAFAYLRARIQGLWGSASQGIGETTPRERRIYLLYSLLAGAFLFWILSMVASWFGGFLIGRYQGWGLILFTGLLLTVFRNPLRAMLRKLVSFFRPGVGMITVMKRLVIVFAVGVPTLAILLLGRMELKVSGEFTILPVHNADIRAQVDGIIEEIYVREGDAVDQGEAVARLSDRYYRAELEETRAEIAEKRAQHRMAVSGPRPDEVELARTTVEKASERLNFAHSELDRLRALYQQQFTAQRDFDKAREEVAIREKELEEAEGELRVLRGGSRPEEIEAIEADIARLEAHQHYLEQQLERVRVTSPLSGLITTPRPEERVGQYVEKGDLIVEVHELKTVTAEIAVSEKDISDVKVGQKVVLKARAFPHTSFRGTVTSVAPIVTKPDEAQAERTITVTTELANPSLLLKPQMSGNARIYCGQQRIFDLVTRRLARYLKVEFWSWW